MRELTTAVASVAQATESLDLIPNMYADLRGPRRFRSAPGRKERITRSPRWRFSVTDVTGCPRGGNPVRLRAPGEGERRLGVRAPQPGSIGPPVTAFSASTQAPGSRPHLGARRPLPELASPRENAARKESPGRTVPLLHQPYRTAQR